MTAQLQSHNYIQVSTFNCSCSIKLHCAPMIAKIQQHCNSQITVHDNLSSHICGNYWSGQDVAKFICYFQGVNHIHL